MASATVVRDLEGKVALVTGATSGIGRAAPSAVAAAVNVPRSATSRNTRSAVNDPSVKAMTYTQTAAPESNAWPVPGSPGCSALRINQGW